MPVSEVATSDPETQAVIVEGRHEDAYVVIVRAAEVETVGTVCFYLGMFKSGAGARAPTFHLAFLRTLPCRFQRGRARPRLVPPS